MRIALYSRQNGAEEQAFIRTVIEYLQSQQFDLIIHGNCPETGGCHAFFHNHEELSRHLPIDFMVSIGGDGSFIDAANLVGNLNIPLVGINTGRIGFLSGIKKDNFKECFQMLKERRYSLEQRSLLHVDSSEPMALSGTFAVNDITIRATDTDSISAITVWADGQKVNTYWADGLIISTPTGSTAYSMSCGGPILHPQSQVNVLTPIAPHSLSVRPLVIPSNTTLTIEVESRNGRFTLCTDTRKVIVDNRTRLSIRQEDFQIQTVLFHNNNFYNIIREKLLWGLDKRNA
ncbi:MAG: NAD kinase [Bacteroidales bacterium]|nr:NAD kinase [Bacteroidales bacterium]MBR6161519.1 NAD kinase [Bacteroidales bacterium]